MTIRSLLIGSVLVLAACGGTSDVEPTTRSIEVAVNDSTCADVVAVELEEAEPGVFTISVTVSFADIGWDKYADQWIVRHLDGEVLGTRSLTHPHVDEQPFTRSQSGISIADGVKMVEVAARDSVEGFCGETIRVAIPQGLSAFDDPLPFILLNVVRGP